MEKDRINELDYREKLDEFFENSWDDIVQMAKRVSAQTPLDLIGSAWIRLRNLSNPQGFHDLLRKGNALGYVYLVLRHLELDRLRQESIHHHREVSRQTESLVSKEYSPSNVTEHNELIEKMTQQLNKLEKDVFRLRVQEHLNTESIAKELNISRRYVELIIVRIRKKLASYDQG